MAGIYIHIPFCRKACHYCDFHFSTSLNQVDDMVKAICTELAGRQSYLEGQTIETIYFGGGTPSLLSTSQLANILETISHNFKINNDAEITIEANPEDLNSANVKDIASLGINRFSIGVQTINDTLLKYLNRAHSSQQVLKAIDSLHHSNIDNYNLDLIYGIPNLSDEMWIKTLEDTLALKPNHLSCYSLTIEDRTAFGNWRKKNKLNPMADDNVAHQFDLASNFLVNNGFEHYEISNYALPQKLSKHNTSYWKQKYYLGVGPGAHSYNTRSRQINISNNPKYIKSVFNGSSFSTIEKLTSSQKLNEYILTSLRTMWGIDLNYIKEVFDYNLFTKHEELITRLEKEKKLLVSSSKLKLTRSGYLLADSIALELMVEEDQNE